MNQKMGRQGIIKKCGQCAEPFPILPLFRGSKTTQCLQCGTEYQISNIFIPEKSGIPVLVLIFLAAIPVFTYQNDYPATLSFALALVIYYPVFYLGIRFTPIATQEDHHTSSDLPETTASLPQPHSVRTNIKTDWGIYVVLLCTIMMCIFLTYQSGMLFFNDHEYEKPMIHYSLKDLSWSISLLFFLMLFSQQPGNEKRFLLVAITIFNAVSVLSVLVTSIPFTMCKATVG